MANWTPTLLGSRLYAWYDSSDTTTLTASGSTSGSTVTQWRDKSGNARHLSNTRSNYLPIIDTNGFNNKNTVRFQSALMQSVAISLSTGTVSVHGSMMRRSSNYNQDYRLVSFVFANGYDDAGGAGPFYIGANGNVSSTTGLTLHTLRLGQTDAVGPVGPLEQQGCIFSSILDGNYITTWVNATAGTSQTQGAATTQAYMNVGANLIGGSQNGAPYENAPDNNIGEIILVNGSLTTGERQQLEGYLAWNWGTVSSLPSNHPYKNSVPTDGSSASSRSWVPTDLGSALVEWWDANSGVSLSGSNVTSWTGRYANFVASSNSGYAPTFSSTARNNKPGLNFTSSQSVFLSENSKFPKTDMAMAVSAYSASSNLIYILGYGDQTQYAGRGICKLADNRLTFDYYGASFGDVAPAVTTDFFAMIQYASATPLASLYQDGTRLATFTNPLTACSGNGVFAIGYWPPYGNSWIGTIQQVVVCNRALSDSERQQLEGWDSWYTGKNGANLPSNHPYKSSAPTVTVGSAWTPANLTTPAYAWYDANDLSTITKDGSNLVSQWNDKSGNSRHVTQTASAVKPTYGATSLTGVNKPSIYFNGDGLYNTNVSLTGDTVTAFAVMSIVSAGAGNAYGRFVSLSDSAKNADWNSAGGVVPLSINSNNMCAYAYGQQRGTAIAVSYNNTNTWQCGVANSTSNIYRDGTGSAQGTGYGVQSFNSTRMAIGSHADSSETSTIEPCQAYISEVIILKYYPSDADRQLIEGYLNWKWGIQANLPSGHPYRNAAPQAAIPISYSAWNPSNLNIAPIKWFDANDSTTLTINSGLITAWNNKGSEPGNLSMNTSYAPTFSSNAFNNYPAAVFNGSQYLTGAIQLGNPLVSVFVVGYSTTQKNHARMVSFHFTNGSNDSDYNVEGNVAIVKASPDAPNLPQFERNGTLLNGPTSSYGSAGFVNHGFDGTNGYLLSNGGTAVTTVAKSTPLTAQVMQVGGWADGSSSPYDAWIGPISEVIVLNYTPTLAERQRIEGYLAWKWGISIVLPSSHPYKNAAPTTPSAIVYIDFTPWQIRSATLSGWYSASDTTTLSLNGSGVSQWRDKSGKGRHLNQSNTTLQPTYSSISQNGYPGITSNGSQYFLTTTGMAYPASPLSIFILGTAAPSTGNTLRLISFAPSGGTDRSTGGVYLSGQSSGAGSLQYSFSNVYNSYCYFPIGPISILEGYATSTTAAIAAVDAGNYTSNGSTNISGQVALNQMGLFTATDGAGGWPGTISEVIIVSGVLSTVELQKIEGYLAWLNQQQGMLPANNTYRTSTPKLPFIRRRSFSIMC